MLTIIFAMHIGSSTKAIRYKKPISINPPNKTAHPVTGLSQPPDVTFEKINIPHADTPQQIS
jgi:hypothetical protein